MALVSVRLPYSEKRKILVGWAQKASQFQTAADNIGQTFSRAMAGLSWITVLKKRENYRKAFDNFNARKIVKYDEKKIAALLQDAGIIRNKLKINATIQNAKAYLAVQKEFGSFDKYIWQFTNHKTIVNRPKTLSNILPKTPESDAMSKDLLKRGFKFVGSTICYAYMQATGMVNDHVADCYLAVTD